MCTTAVFRPAVPSGGACTGDLECLDGWCTGWALGCGTCQPWRRAGDACGTVCTVGEVCVGRSDGGCAAGLACVDGRCAEPPPPGGVDAPCATTSWPSCAPGLYCDETTTCRRYLLAGEACQDSRQCDWGLDCVSGVCAAVPAPPPAPGCPPGTSSDGAGCAALPTVGDACREWCLAGWCEAGTGVCRAYAAAGAPCRAGDVCAPGFACDAGTCRPPTQVCVP